MMDILMQYGLFLIKAATVVIAVWILTVMLVSLSRRKGRMPERLEVKNLNRKYREMSLMLKRSILPRKEFKRVFKVEKSKWKTEKKGSGGERGKAKRRVFVINFRGDIPATAVSNLREEVTAILSVATNEDEVLVRLENAGGFVHGHGLAASQLMRLRQRNIPLTVAIDKVAASGGYLMACVGNRILAAPFAVVGSIGVLAQLPNFHRFLTRHGIDFEEAKAGEFKRTVTMFGKNTDEEREKLRQQLEETHMLFKNLVQENRPDVDISSVSTGEYWYGRNAVDKKLVDELTTSDDYLLEASKKADIYDVSFIARKPVTEKVASVVQLTMDRLLLSWWRRADDCRYPV